MKIRPDIAIQLYCEQYSPEIISLKSKDEYFNVHVNIIYTEVSFKI